MTDLAGLRECVAFLLIAAGNVLAERRRLTKAVAPGAIAIPGGHIEAGEEPEEAVRREVREELGVVPRDLRYVCTLRLDLDVDRIAVAEYRRVYEVASP